MFIADRSHFGLLGTATISCLLPCFVRGGIRAHEVVREVVWRLIVCQKRTDDGFEAKERFTVMDAKIRYHRSHLAVRWPGSGPENLAGDEGKLLYLACALECKEKRGTPALTMQIGELGGQIAL